MPIAVASDPAPEPHRSEASKMRLQRKRSQIAYTTSTATVARTIARAAVDLSEPVAAAAHLERNEDPQRRELTDEIQAHVEDVLRHHSLDE